MPQPHDTLRRLNFGCGSSTAPGWINCDIRPGSGVDLVCDIRDGLPLADDGLECVLSIHALQALPYPELVPALAELRRVLMPGAVLRLSLPDAERAIRAFHEGDAGYFLIPDDEVRSLGGKMSVQLTWYGHSRSLFTADYVEELLHRAGFRQVVRSSFGATSSDIEEITQLDDREGESLFVEAYK